MKSPEYNSKKTNYFVKFWRFLQQDTWQSWVVSLILLVILIRFILFPFLSFLTGSSLPLVVIESCSMYHSNGFEKWWNDNANWYELRGIEKQEFKEFPFHNGLNKGDIIFVLGRTDYKLGDIIIFQPNSDSTAPHPIIHRIVDQDPYQTKGDHNFGQLIGGNPSNSENIDETNIGRDQIIGKSAFRVPLLGWIKLIFFEPLRPSYERGFCE